MGFRFRKRIKLLPGLHINIGKTGTSISIGRPGASINIGGKRGSSSTIGIPGTGISHTTSVPVNPPAEDSQMHHQTTTKGIGFFRLLGYAILALFILLILRGLLAGS